MDWKFQYFLLFLTSSLRNSPRLNCSWGVLNVFGRVLLVPMSLCQFLFCTSVSPYVSLGLRGYNHLSLLCYVHVYYLVKRRKVSPLLLRNSTIALPHFLSRFVPLSVIQSGLRVEPLRRRPQFSEYGKLQLTAEVFSTGRFTSKTYIGLFWCH